MTTLYIAGPMTGIEDYNYPAFNRAELALRRRGFDVLNPVDSEEEWEGEYQQAPWDWYLRRALRMLTYAEGVALLPGWHNSRGAGLERTVADRLGMPSKPLHEWLEEGQ